MESKYNIENFERFLRDKTDEFKMYPSKRVWYSIYNNMHPGNRLPSISMCIVLICSLLLVGYLNTGSNQEMRAAKVLEKSSSIASNESNSRNITGVSTTPPVSFNNVALSQTNTAVNNGSADPVYAAAISNTAANVSGHLNNATLPGTQNITGSGSDENTAAADIRTSTQTIAAVTETGAQPQTITTVNTNPTSQFVAGADQGTFIQDVSINQGSNNSIVIATASKNLSVQQPATQDQAGTNAAPAADSKMQETASNEAVAAITVKPVETQQAGNAVSSETVAGPCAPTPTITAASDKAWIENYAMYNRPATKKWAGKLSWQAYLTPSVVYRKLYNNTANKDLSGNGTGNFNNANVDVAVAQKPSFGLETGLSLQYDFLKVLKLKAGLQLNYTRYNAQAYENQHPIASSITLNSEENLPYEVFRTTPYSNNIGLNPVSLHNETYQLSLPVGADLKLFSTDLISWYAGATIQPTFVMYANSYLISSDRRNYIKDRSMLNRFNVNAGFETYLSFKTSGYTWQVGPQFRSQIFSTNNKIYSVEERLMNFGFKIGITKKL